MKNEKIKENNIEDNVEFYGFFYLYKNNYKHYLEMGVDLDQFVALMPNDIREEYENIKREKTSNS